MAYFLSCNNLTSPSCSVGDYVIDWHLNSVSGDIIFVSANSGNPEPGVDAYHPIVDEVVPAGTLYAVIRYVYVGSDKITSDYEEGALYSPDLITCLGSVVVDPIDCEASNFTPTTTFPYDFKIARSVGVGSKDRNFIFSIENTTNFIAWAFVGYVVADGVKVYYCTALDSVGTLMDYLISGSSITEDYSPVDYPNDPIVLNNVNPVKYVSDLRSFTYAVGDYVRFEIIGNIYNPSIDSTAWDIYLRCLDTLDEPVDINDFDTIIDTPYAFYNETVCGYQVNYTTQEVFTGSLFTTSVLPKYFTSTVQSQNARNTTVGGSASLTYNIFISNSFPVNNTSCILSAGNINFNKTGLVLTWTFSDSADYLAMVADITTIQSDARWATYLAADPSTDAEAYGYYTTQVSGNCPSCDGGCGTTNVELRIPFNAVITYDPVDEEVLVITLPATAITYDLPYPSVACDNTYSTINTTSIGAQNTTRALADFTRNNAIRRVTQITGFFVTRNTSATTTISSKYYNRVYVVMMNNIFDLTDYGYCIETNQYRGYQVYDRLTITDPSTPETRLSSIRLERSRKFTTDNCADATTYDIIVDPVTPSTTTTTTTL